MEISSIRLTSAQENSTMRSNLTIARAYRIRPLLAAAFGLALAFTFSCSSGDDSGGGGGGGGGNTSATLSMKAIAYANSTYHYKLENYSSYEVRITVNGTTETMAPYASLTGNHGSAFFSNTNGNPITVTYSPANKVRYEEVNGNGIRFYDK